MTPSDDLDIIVETAGWTARLPDIRALGSTAVHGALALAPAERGEVAIAVLLTDDATMRRLNGAYRGQDKPTNVLSFPADAGTHGGFDPDGFGPAWLGDIAVGLEAAVREAENEEKPLADHVCHLIVHGTLHLLGYDHEHDADAEIMEQMETRVLASLGVPDPYRRDGA